MRELGIRGAFVNEHKVFGDSRGLFREWFKKSDFEKVGVNFDIAQANFSQSSKGVLRGLHYSISPEGQAKLVTCTSGEILDVIVDLRLNSPTYLRVEMVNLKANAGEVLFIPSGVGHSFLVLSDTASVAYLTSSEFNADAEKTISPLDPALGIVWPSINGVDYELSDRDKAAPPLSEARELGILPSF